MLRVSILLLVLVITLAYTSAQAGTSKLYSMDNDMFMRQKDKVCPFMPDIGGGKFPQWSDVMTEEEVYELALLNMGYGLTSDAIAHLPEDLGYKKQIIDTIAHIAQMTCNTDAVSSTFINAAKNLFLYYILKMMKSPVSVMNGTKSSEFDPVWDEILSSLTVCSGEIDPITITDVCGIAESYQTQAGGMKDTYIVREQFDEEMSGPDAGIDIIVDSVWWMFTIAYARCYAHFYPNEDIILVFFQRFREDIMEMFTDRWRGAGAFADHFDIIFGPYDVDDDYISLRKCATISFDYEGLGGRQLVRPVTVTVGGSTIRNMKLV